jgi:ribulose-phosphate 3-epimerase
VSRFRIAPSILSADFGRLGEEVRAAEAAGADWIHCDVMDGHFVPNLTFGPDVVAAVSAATGLPRDVHLMVERPDELIDAFADAGATSLGVHVEACTHLHRSLQRIRARGLRTSVVLNPATPEALIEPALPWVDQVLVMTVNPGFGGQSFIRETTAKLRRIRAWIEKSAHAIALTVDGGINLEPADGPGGSEPTPLELTAEAGADVFVIGSAFFKSPDYSAFVARARRLLRPHE